MTSTRVALHNPPSKHGPPRTRAGSVRERSHADARLASAAGSGWRGGSVVGRPSSSNGTGTHDKPPGGRQAGRGEPGYSPRHRPLLDAPKHRWMLARRGGRERPQGRIPLRRRPGTLSGSAATGAPRIAPGVAHGPDERWACWPYRAFLFRCYCEAVSRASRDRAGRNDVLVRRHRQRQSGPPLSGVAGLTRRPPRILGQGRRVLTVARTARAR